MKDPEEKEMMAYMAGLIDGDGHIGMRSTAKGHIPLIQLHNSIKKMPEYLKKVFGGTLAYDRPKEEGNRIIWKWMLQGREGVRNCLHKLIPYLVLKKDSAYEVLEFLDRPVEGKNYYDSCKNLNSSRKTEDFSSKSIDRKNNENPFFWAYVAGIMDTDGSFSVERSVRKPAKGNRQKKDLIKYRPKILLTMVGEKAIRYILGNFEYGSFSVVRAKTALRGEALRLSISARGEAIEFLKKCIPYLQIKAIQAIKLITFCRYYSPTNGLAKVPEEEVKFREDCYREMIMLNNTPS